MGSERRQHTTALIQRAAVEEFTQVGPRALSLTSIARRSFVSVGAVYERWSDREACVADLVSTQTPHIVTSVAQDWTDPEHGVAALARADLGDPERLQQLRFLAEVVFAARDDAALEADARSGLATLESAVAARLPGASLNPALAWWALSTWLGTALLRTSGCPIPEAFDTLVAELLESGAGTFADPSAGMFDARVPGDHPLPVDERPVGDATAAALVKAAHQVISQRGALDADLRTVAREAGVTTGAVYRRFSSRSELMIRAFVSQLSPERYAWTPDFLSILDRSGLDGAADFWADLCQRIWENEAESRLLLEFTIAAHTDDRVRASIIKEITVVAENRAYLFARFIDAGIIDPRHSAEALAWTLQVPPVGMRLLASIGIVPTRTEIHSLMRGYLMFLVEGE